MCFLLMRHFFSTIFIASLLLISSSAYVQDELDHALSKKSNKNKEHHTLEDQNQQILYIDTQEFLETIDNHVEMVAYFVSEYTTIFNHPSLKTLSIEMKKINTQNMKLY